MPEEKTFVVEDARLIFLNFEGKEGQYNRKGDRNFGLVLTEELAEQLTNDGWNVKHLKPRDEGDEPTPWLEIAVSFRNRPPRIFLLSNGGKTRVLLSEENVEIVDIVEMKSVDLIVRGYDWEVNDKTGTKAYLKTMYITILEDELDRKYGASGASVQADD